MAWGTGPRGWGDGPSADFQKVYLAHADSTVLNGGTIADTGGSLRFTVPGSAATPNISSAVVALWRVRDTNNSAVTAVDGSIMLPHMMKIKEIAAPSLTSDTWVGCGFVNDATLANVEGSLAALLYRSSAREVRGGEWADGVLTSTDSGAIANLETVIGTVNTRNGGDLGHLFATGHDGTFTSHLGQVSHFINLDFSGDVYFFVAAGRTAATAGSVTVDVDAGYAIPSLYALDGGF